MKKFNLLICLCFFSLLSYSQLTTNSGQTYTTFNGVDYIFVYNGINTSTEITYSGSGTSFDWYTFSNPTVSISNLPYISPEDATGYILKVDGNQVATLWVIDYSEYLPDFISFEPDFDSEKPCETLRLLLNANIPELYYETASGQRHSIPRSFTVGYQTQSWDDKAWTTNDTTVNVNVPATFFDVPAPLSNTAFVLTANDQFATDLGITPGTIESAVYLAVAVKNKLTTATSIREAENEDQRPSTEDIVSGSAPLDILFKANPTEGVMYNQWSIYKNDAFVLTRNEAEHRYSFQDYGSYKVVLVSSNPTCSFSDSVTIEISESALEVPNVFTPNGDGMNDEFRVAFRSLKKFECVVYNRWGNKVYHSTDPLKGWDGTIGGRRAVSAAYFYVIKAEGTDGKKYHLKGDINLIR